MQGQRACPLACFVGRAQSCAAAHSHAKVSPKVRMLGMLALSMQSASFGEMRRQNALFREGETSRMCFSVRWLDVCPGEEKRILRKSTFCGRGATEKRILRSRCDGKVHSATETLRKSAFCVAARMQSASFGEVRRQSALFRNVAHLECAFP